jgi:hypothetical protein
MIFRDDKLAPARGPAAGRKETKRALETACAWPLETFCTQLETRVDFFYFFARNPLKSHDSDEKNQGNPSFFAWFYLDLLGRISRFG